MKKGELRGRIAMGLAAFACIATSAPRWTIEGKLPNGAPQRTDGASPSGLIVVTDSSRTPAVSCNGVEWALGDLRPVSATTTVFEDKEGAGTRTFLCPPSGTLGTITIGEKGGQGGGLCSAPKPPPGEYIRITSVEKKPMWSKSSELNVDLTDGHASEDYPTRQVFVVSAYTTYLYAVVDPPNDALGEPRATHMHYARNDAGMREEWMIGVKKKSATTKVASVKVTAKSWGLCTDAACTPPADAEPKLETP